jgi:hypothetical protein
LLLAADRAGERDIVASRRGLLLGLEEFEGELARGGEGCGKAIPRALSLAPTDGLRVSSSPTGGYL